MVEVEVEVWLLLQYGMGLTDIERGRETSSEFFVLWSGADGEVVSLIHGFVLRAPRELILYYMCFEQLDPFLVACAPLAR